MKKLIALLILTAQLCCVETELKYDYVKVDLSLLKQNIGWGSRTRDLAEKSGYDKSFNTNFMLGAGLTLLPSYKYTTLTYKDNTLSSKYQGVGFEVGIPVSTLVPWIITPVPIPNVELVFGTEYGDDGYSQLGINLLPVAAGVIGFMAEATSQGRPLSSLAGPAMAVAGGMSAFSYTWTF